MQELATGFGLIEAPVWQPGTGLYFSDVLNGGVHLLRSDGDVSLIVPKRKGVGGMALHQAGGLVMGGRDICFFPFEDASPKSWLKISDVQGATGFNDLTTDAEGRIYVGSLAFRVFGGEEPKAGKLHVIDLDGSVRAVSDGILLTNGLGFSPDGRRLYHSDSRSNHVRVYETTGDGGLGPFRIFAAMDGGVPDGLKVASDGSVWVADARGGRVAVFNPDGSHRRDIAVPLPMVTSVCFGGEDLKDLYVVTGSDGGPRANCGTIFRTRADVAGLPLSAARVSIA
ncbi:MAG: SMP-30/gluconolactonase/LRE family protein [Alphaproteobacteria bacterium]|nr:SMP-30/gluconolactonase/LRE family protein [Alphaproteobacteria bacterium]